MPTIPLTLQGDGTWRGWTSLTGASFGYLCVDDSTDTTHDSGATKINLGRLLLNPQGGRMSFPIGYMAEHLTPTNFTVNVAAVRGGANHPDIQVGFSKGLTAAFDPVVFTTGASYAVRTWNFTTNPLTGAPWTEDDIHGLEVCIQSMSGQLGSNDISLVSISAMDYTVSSLHSALRPEWMVA